MIAMGLSFLLFFCCLAAHAYIHRMFRRRNIITLRSTLPYIVGLAVLVCTLAVLRLPAQVTAAVQFCLLSGLTFILYMTIYLGGETPSSMMLASFTKRNVQSREDLISLFSEDMLIWKRVRDLIAAHLVVKSGNLYTATPRGELVAGIAGWYGKIFHRPDPV